MTRAPCCRVMQTMWAPIGWELAHNPSVAQPYPQQATPQRESARVLVWPSRQAGGHHPPYLSMKRALQNSPGQAALVAELHDDAALAITGLRCHGGLVAGLYGVPVG